MQEQYIQCSDFWLVHFFTQIHVITFEIEDYLNNFGSYCRWRVYCLIIHIDNRIGSLAVAKTMLADYE